MKRTYAMKRLLEHGPLDVKEAAEITGWGIKYTGAVLCQLVRTKVVKPVRVVGHRRLIYELPKLVVEPA